MSEEFIDFCIVVFVIILLFVIIYGITILKECNKIIKQCDKENKTKDFEDGKIIR